MTDKLAEMAVTTLPTLKNAQVRCPEQPEARSHPHKQLPLGRYRTCHLHQTPPTTLSTKPLWGSQITSTTGLCNTASAL